jgi:hypothetical protein
MTEYQERFTLRLPGYLHTYLKRVAKQQHRSLNNLIVHVDFPHEIGFFGPVPNDAPEWREADKRD